MQHVDPSRMSRSELITRIDNLEAEVEALRDAGKPDRTLRLQNAFHLTAQECKLVALLSDGRPRRKEQIMSGIYSDRIDDPPEMKIIDVWVCKVRRKLDPHGVHIETVWGSGYYLTDHAGVLKLVMDGGVPPLVNAPPERPHPQHLERRKKGADIELLLADFRSHDDGNGMVSFRYRELAARTGVRRTISSLMDRLEHRGLIKIVSRPQRGADGGPWIVRLAASQRAEKVSP